VNQNGIFLLGPTLMEFGTAEQKARYLPKMASATRSGRRLVGAEAGSDLAAVRATALLDGDHYVLRGHKIWSSRAAFADWCFGIFRTEPAQNVIAGSRSFSCRCARRRARARHRQIHGEPGFARSSSRRRACRWQTVSARKDRDGTSRWRRPGSSVA
jgi:alkylation response protein AidB-like acyl-CoA dehydrogenase